MEASQASCSREGHWCSNVWVTSARRQVHKSSLVKIFPLILLVALVRQMPADGATAAAGDNITAKAWTVANSRTLTEEHSHHIRHTTHWHKKTFKDSEEERLHYYHKAQELEVFIGRIAGTLENKSSSHTPEVVTVHFYIKSVQHNNTMAEVGGVYFVESMERVWLNHGQNALHISQPPLAIEWKPRIFLRLPSSKTEWDFATDQHNHGLYKDENGHERPQCSSPFALKVLLPIEKATGVNLELHIEGFKRAEHFPFDKYYSPFPTTTSEPQVWLLLKVPFGWDGTTTAQQIIYHNVYHTRLGFSGTIQYVDVTYLALLLTNPGIIELIDSDCLRLILWDQMLACKEKEPCFIPRADKPMYEQVLQYNHAVQAFRGQNMLLALVDRDEYLAINNPQHTVQQVYRDCWGENPFIKLENFRAEPPNYSKPDWRRYWVMGGFKSHPLEHYKSVRYDHKVNEYGKSIVNPDVVEWCYVHECQFPSGTPMHWPPHEPPETNGSCAYWLHVVNQNGVRMQQEDGAGSVEISKWRWVLDEL